MTGGINQHRIIEPMLKWIIAYGVAAVSFLALDAVWLRWASVNLYKPVIGEIMAKDFNVGAAAAFYFIYIAGMCWFAIKPGLEGGGVQAAMLNGILLGALCYILALVYGHAASFGEGKAGAGAVLNLSRTCSIVMLVAYFGCLFFQLKTHRQLFEAQEVSYLCQPLCLPWLIAIRGTHAQSP